MGASWILEASFSTPTLAHAIALCVFRLVGKAHEHHCSRLLGLHCPSVSFSSILSCPRGWGRSKAGGFCSPVREKWLRSPPRSPPEDRGSPGFPAAPNVGPIIGDRFLGWGGRQNSKYSCWAWPPASVFVCTCVHVQIAPVFLHVCICVSPRASEHGCLYNMMCLIHVCLCGTLCVCATMSMQVYV